MTAFEKKTRFGDEETGVEVCRRSGEMRDFFADSQIFAASLAKLTSRSIEIQWGIVV